MNAKKCFIITIACALCVAVTACTWFRSIIIIVPDDYGPGSTYSVVLDSHNGIQPEFTEDGAVVYTFSEPGTHYNSLSAFENYRDVVFMTTSGTLIKTTSKPPRTILGGPYANRISVILRGYASEVEPPAGVAYTAEGESIRIEFFWIE